jgi:hypothetical protein
VWRRTAAAGLVLAVVVAVGLLGVGTAAAAPELTVSPASGPPGTEFVVTGSGFAALPVEIRWGGLSGPVIATAAGPAFSVTAVAPESQPNSVPVTAVVIDGSSVSTSSASFQVTSAAAPPVEETTTTTTTSTTVAAAEPPPTTPAASIPGGEVGRAPIRSGSGLSGGVDGGLDPDMAGTTNGGDASSGAGGGTAGAANPSAGAGGGTTATSTANTTPAAGVADTTVPSVAVAPGAAPALLPPGTPAPDAVPAVPGDGVTEGALAPARTSQSAGAVSNPILLFVGLALVFGGGVFLAIRNRQRA